MQVYFMMLTQGCYHLMMNFFRVSFDIYIYINPYIYVHTHMHVEQFSPAFLGRWEGNGEINCGDPNRLQMIPTTHSGRPCSASLGIFGGRARSLMDALPTLSPLFSKQTVPASLTEKGGQKKGVLRKAVPTPQPRRKKFTGSSEPKGGVGTLSHGGGDVYNRVMALDHQEV